MRRSVRFDEPKTFSRRAMPITPTLEAPPAGGLEAKVLTAEFKAPSTSGTVLDPVQKTSLSIAKCRAAESFAPSPLVADPLAQSLSGASTEELVALLKNSPGKVDRIAVRTRYFDDIILAAVRGGPAPGLWAGIPAPARQMVLVAAGMDSRAYRLGFPPGVRVFELDFAPVLEHKQRQIERIVPAPELSCTSLVRIAADVSPLDTSGTAWTEELCAAGYDPEVPSVWVFEGLLYYLTEERVQRLLGEYAATTRGNSIAVASIVTGNLREGNLFKWSCADFGSFAESAGVRMLSQEFLGGEVANYGRWKDGVSTTAYVVFTAM